MIQGGGEPTVYAARQMVILAEYRRFIAYAPNL